MAKLTQLVAMQELSAGQVSAQRNRVIKDLLARASRELKMDEKKLVVRDIRPFTDLAWGTDINVTDGLANAALTADRWDFTTDAALSGWLSAIVAASRTMADQRYVAIYGLRDSRMAYATILAIQCTLWRFQVGHSYKAIWDSSKCYAYSDHVAGFSPVEIVIPQNTQFNIFGYLPAAVGNVLSYVSFEGVVVEPSGKVVSPE